MVDSIIIGIGYFVGLISNNKSKVICMIIDI